MKVAVDKEKCTGCCVNVCPVNAIKIEGRIAIISDECIECGACINVCRAGAMTM
jgi:Fe-S-cluster-containing hydrogenase component 2